MKAHTFYSATPQNASVAPCWDLPETTFGGAYARFMGDRNFEADERPPVR